MTSTAIRYHFATTDDLLHALTDDFLAELDLVMERHPKDPEWPSGVERLVTDFVSVVLAYRDVALLLHQDNHLLGRKEFGERLERALLQIRRAITGPSPTSADTVAAVCAIGGIWRPIEVLAPSDVAGHIDAIVRVILSGHPRG